MTAYAELQVTTNFSFLRGASHAEELALTAASLGYRALGVTDRNTLAGVVRAHLAARSTGMRLVVGCRLDLTDGPSLLCWPTDRAAYGRLSRLLTLGKRRAPKGECWIGRADIAAQAEGQVLAVIPPDTPDAGFAAELEDYRNRFGSVAARGRLHLLLTHRYQGDDARRLEQLARLAADKRLPTLAGNDVHYHTPARRPLQDVLTCIRDGCTIRTAGWRLHANAERHLKPPGEMARLFRHHADAVARTVSVAEACRFSLEELRYEYPDEVAPGGDAQAELERLTWAGAAHRYPDSVPDKVRAVLAHELALIAQLRYAPYFLTVHDVVRFARSRGILCQGRGSAANSAICYVIGITAVDPAKCDLLFERFVSAARNEPPDIDVDFEHERREEVIQYIYDKYGRDRAGIAATVSSYRARGALREVGKAMGLSLDVVGRLAGAVWGWGQEALDPEHARQQGLDPDDPLLRRTLALAGELMGFPRHLSQHVGGFVITKGLLSELCPILNAAMDGRTNIEWDKDDIDALGILKVDVLALGMLTCVRKAFDLIAAHHGRRYSLATVPAEVPGVYDMLCKADSIGVFQVESRAQMTMLPRLKPRAFYDLVIEVAIVRPGPIQGDMVHPYLRRRQGLEKVDYPSEALRAVLEKTLGVPLFQEQAMKIAIVGAGFSPEDADRLRRAMATFRKNGDIHTFREKFIGGMLANGYAQDFAERCFQQIEGFGTYGFPESHAASFALLVYVSAWIKWRHPDVFACALLNSQPMGFYAPAQIVRDARDHGVTVLPPDVNHAEWDCTLEEGAAPNHPSLLGAHGIHTSSEVAGAELRAPFDRLASSETISVIPAKAGIQESRWQCAWPLDPGFRRDDGEMCEYRSLGGGKERGYGLENPEAENEPHRILPLRLGFRLIKGLREDDMRRLATARAEGGPFRSPRDLWRRAKLSRAALEKLAQADAFRSLGLDRRRALWAVEALGDDPLPLFAALADGGLREPATVLPDMPLGEHVVEDYASLSLSLKAHPLALLRERLTALHAPDARRHPLIRAEQQQNLPDRRRVAVAGLVLVRQRPGSAKGVIFLTLEDETGVANCVLMPDIFETFRRQVLGGRLLTALGRIEKMDSVIHVRVERLVDHTDQLRTLTELGSLIDPNMWGQSVARADEVKRPTADHRKPPREATLDATRDAARVTQVERVFPDGRNFR